jgi:hypothetical protein
MAEHHGPLVSAHSGISGSRYDVLVPSRMNKASAAFGETVLSQRQTIAASKGGGGASLPLREMLVRRGATSPRGVSGGAAGNPSTDWVLDKEHREVLSIVFAFLDTDGDGALDESQLKVALATFGIPPTFSLMASVMETEDKIDEKALVAILERYGREKPIDPEIFRDLFRFFELPSSVAKPRLEGFVHADSLVRLFTEFRTVFDTQLDMDDFVTLLTSLNLSPTDVVHGPEFLKALTSGFLRVGEEVATTPSHKMAGRFFG